MHNEKEPCDCGHTSWILNDPGSGFKISEHNQIILETQDGSWYAVRFCVGCGGRLPNSGQPIWYPRLDAAEFKRIETLLEGLETAEQAIQRLGPPDYDAYMVQYNHPDTIMPIIVSEHDVVNQPGWVYNGEESMKCRNIEYYNLSEGANILLYFREDHPRSMDIQVKYVPPRNVEEI